MVENYNRISSYIADRQVTGKYLAKHVSLSYPVYSLKSFESIIKQVRLKFLDEALGTYNIITQLYAGSISGIRQAKALVNCCSSQYPIDNIPTFKSMLPFIMIQNLPFNEYIYILYARRI